MGAIRGRHLGLGRCRPPRPFTGRTIAIGYLLASVLGGLVLLGPPAAAGVTVYESPDIAPAKTLLESPFLADEVAAGKMPPVDRRVPRTPHVVPTATERIPGRFGGELRTLVAKGKDTRLLVAYGYARLVGYDEKLNLVPDILERVEVEDGRRAA